MAPVGDVSFELERFEWTADDTLEVVGKWNGLRPGRRLTRPALTVEAGGRRHRVNGSADLEGEDWRASFEWDGSRGDVASAELELGRSLVVELPAPRRRRRRRGATAEFELRSTLAALTAERDELRAELEAARAAPRPEPDASRAEDPDDATNLREALTAAAAARAEAEAARADAERLAGELATLRAKAPATEELEALRSEADSARADAERLRVSLSEAESRGEAAA